MCTDTAPRDHDGRSAGRDTLRRKAARNANPSGIGAVAPRASATRSSGAVDVPGRAPKAAGPSVRSAIHAGPRHRGTPAGAGEGHEQQDGTVQELAWADSGGRRRSARVQRGRDGDQGPGISQAVRRT